MKKITIFFIAVSFLFISCGQAAFGKPEAPQGYGTVIIGISGNGVSRAVGSNGLPLLNNSQMTIKVTKDDGTLIREETFAESAPKTMSLTLPVGEKIVVKVIVKNVSARWSGEESHEVTSGTNTVSVKLKKAAAALNDLLFGTNKSYSSYSDYTLKLKIGSKEIVNKTNIWHHSFCRDK
ncbi:hypothetical protein C5N99_09890 [Treponema medium]|uniref:hypothetical protein n=1 Tax=Treponema medium TaxID=58231 RepID=UPI00198025CD|nr:hypothetical protein [Treponema medium]QSH92896.1 hypothetical protein C5N99_09890 [Treponema medium]